ncbi:hypothetical protein [Pseudoalteromonas sp. SR41-7]|uniref:hypothetical protein n=1 Tax=Pseudoalteromonas sp. SR41-7 TaxID=2760947 RepID=UPI001602599F|nr:hypothetical protein [Pseudoalteromonas sp. SR41-7]MBB1299194.1 hypothetical protein [Pseudoalteromonas sp. SR41-7]
MQPIKLLSKLSTKTLNLTGTFGGSGQDVIDWRTAAHALAGLPQCQTNWAYFRYVGEETRLNRVVRSLTMHITLFVKIKQYKVKPETLNGIVMAAIHEFVQPVCGECDGSGLVPGQKATNLNAEICIKCYGRGRKTVSTRSRCKIIGIGHKSYTDSHDDITKELLRLIACWESDIFKNIRVKMEDVA